MRGPGARFGPERLGRSSWIVALAAAAWVALETSFHGPGLDNDAAEYLAAAASLTEGDGWVGVDGRPYTLWAPLYPMLIAAVDLLSTPATAVRAIQAASVAAVALLVAAIASRSGASRLVATLAAALASISILRIASMAWSEPAFAALALLATWCWSRYRERPDRARLLALSLALALVFAQRYVGLALIATFAAALALARDLGPPRVRLARAATMSALAALPVCAWMARNRLVTRSFEGRRGPPAGDGAGDTVDAVFELLPFVPRALELRAVLALVPLALLALGSLRLAKGRLAAGAGVLPVAPLALAAALVALRQVVELDAIEARLMAPALPFVVLVGASGASHLVERLSGAARAAALAIVAGWMAVVALDVGREADRRLASARAKGKGLYDSPAWRGSPTIAWLREHPLERRAASNEPFALYVLLGVRAGHLPARPSSYRNLVPRWRDDARPRTVVWFRFNRRALFPADALGERFRVTRVLELADGELWSVDPLPDGTPAPERRRRAR